MKVFLGYANIKRSLHLIIFANIMEMFWTCVLTKNVRMSYWNALEIFFINEE